MNENVPPPASLIRQLCAAAPAAYCTVASPSFRLADDISGPLSAFVAV